MNSPLPKTTVFYPSINTISRFPPPEERHDSKPTIRTGTISKIHKLLVSEGHQVSEYTLRLWVKRGVLPAAYSGRTAYINADNVRRLLEQGTPIPPAPPKR